MKTLVALFLGVVLLSGRRPRPLLTDYYLPTAAAAAGTVSSLATLPLNLAQIRKVGVRPEVSNFVLPFGAVVNIDASAMAYLAYAPFVLTQVFDLQVSWTVLLVAWPALVAFTVAAPGLPAGMGTALWNATLFGSMPRLGETERAEVVATWIALSGGIPDMIRTATNCTGDGFTSVIFDRWFGIDSEGDGHDPYRDRDESDAGG